MSSSRGAYSAAPHVDLENDLIDPDDADLNDFDDQLATTSRTPLAGGASSSSAASNQPTGSIGGTLNPSYLTSRIGGIDRRSGANSASTIDESVWATLRRDLLAVWAKLREVLYPRHLLSSVFGPGAGDEGFGGLGGAYARLREGGLAVARDAAGRVLDPEALVSGDNAARGLREWDLWGPLVFCLLLSLLLSFNAREKQKEAVFSGVFAIVWIGEAVVTLQIKLLGGNISFAQSICVIGYTLFPLVIAALLSAVHVPTVVRIPVYLFLVLWSLAAGVSILGGSGVVRNRVGLAVYPLFIFYFSLGCLCFIS